MSERTYYSREAEERAYRNQLLTTLVVAGFGIGIGAILALLLAPRPGDETRRYLGETLDQATAQGREVTGQVIKTMVEGAEKLQEELSERGK